MAAFIDNSYYSIHTTRVRISISSVEGLQSAHSGDMPFQRDGCYFLHKEGNYATEGLPPLALLWKDPECSQYFIDTDANGIVPQHQNLILQYSEEGSVCTADNPPVSLGGLPKSFAATSMASLRCEPMSQPCYQLESSILCRDSCADDTLQ